MRLVEETILMLLNEESGYLEQVQGWNLSCVLAGAVLADLALEGRIDTDLESLTLLDATETGDELLDPRSSTTTSAASGPCPGPCRGAAPIPRPTARLPHR